VAVNEGDGVQGFVFRAQPTLMTVERSATIMDAIFSSPDEDGRARLLKIIQDFLVSEAARHSAVRQRKTMTIMDKDID
jgi:cohesin loading factor subunit SCC2